MWEGQGFKPSLEEIAGLKTPIKKRQGGRMGEKKERKREGGGGKKKGRETETETETDRETERQTDRDKRQRDRQREERREKGGERREEREEERERRVGWGSVGAQEAGFHPSTAEPSVVDACNLHCQRWRREGHQFKTTGATWQVGDLASTLNEWAPWLQCGP